MAFSVWSIVEGRQALLIAAFSVAFGLAAPWQHVWQNKSHADREPWVLLIMQRTWATTQFVPFLYLALRLYGRVALASRAVIAWGLWVHGVEVALAAFSPLDDLVENLRCAVAPAAAAPAHTLRARSSPTLQTRSTILYQPHTQPY
tara:strand:- start:56 stop:493 length:438 start_codon:yes stop_codon:yes gene_type:complete